MKTTDCDFLQQHFAALGLSSGQNVVVHSALAPLGLLQGGVQMLGNCLQNYLGPSATIAVPTYRLNAPVGETFDRASSLSLNVGSLSEYARRQPNAVRSCNPLHSHAFVGPLAKHFIQDSVRPSFGEGSDFAFFVERGFRCILLGCDLENAGTFVFHSQALSGNIPYRSWQIFERSCADQSQDKSAELVRFRYYARNKDAPRETRRTLEKPMVDAGLLMSAPVAYGKSMAFDCAPTCDFLVQLFLQQPDICVQAKKVSP